MRRLNRNDLEVRFLLLPAVKMGQLTAIVAAMVVVVATPAAAVAAAAAGAARKTNRDPHDGNHRPRLARHGSRIISGLLVTSTRRQKRGPAAPPRVV